MQRRSRVTVEDILIAAAHVFDDLGYASGTTNRIAAKAGVSIGTLYQYFSSKEAIAIALLERHVHDAMQRLRQWVSHCLTEQLSLDAAIAWLVHGILELHLEQPRLQRMLLEETPRTGGVQEAWHAAEREAARIIAGLLRCYPEVRHPTLERAAWMTVQTVQALTHHFAADPEHAMPRDAFEAELVALVRAYLVHGAPGCQA